MTQMKRGKLSSKDILKGKACYQMIFTLVYVCRIYCLPKLYKPAVPLRPFVSAVESYTHGLATYLSDILKPLINRKFTVKDSFSFVHELLSVGDTPYICSFDVISLYTNIPD